jgi:hypothetical protein
MTANESGTRLPSRLGGRPADEDDRRTREDAPGSPVQIGSENK